MPNNRNEAWGGDGMDGSQAVVTPDTTIPGHLEVGTLEVGGASTFTGTLDGALIRGSDLEATDDLTVGDVIVAQPTAREKASLTAQNLKGEPFPRLLATGHSTGTTGVMYASGVGLIAGDVVTDVFMRIGANGVSLTLVRVGIYNSSYVLDASSADVDTNFTAGTIPRMQQVSLSSPYTIPTTGLYFIAILQVGTTGASIMRLTPSQGAMQVEGAGTLPYWQSVGGQTDLPTGPLTPQDGVIVPWFGWN